MKFKKILFPVISLTMCSLVSAQQLRCDQLAASPYDSEKVTAGVPYDKINSSIAIPACREAVERNPKVSRLWFQYGRALEKGNKVADAIIAYQEAIKFNHAAALNNIGELYRDGKGFEKNPRKAEEFFAKAAQYGSTEGAANLKDVNKEKSPPKEVSVEPRRDAARGRARAEQRNVHLTEINCKQQAEEDCYVNFQKSNDIIRVIYIVSPKSARTKNEWINSYQYLIDCSKLDYLGIKISVRGDLNKFDFNLAQINNPDEYKHWFRGSLSKREELQEGITQDKIKSTCNSSDVKINPEVEIAYNKIVDWRENGGFSAQVKKEMAQHEAAQLNQIGKYRVFMICNYGAEMMANELMQRYLRFKNGEVPFDYYYSGIKQASNICQQVNQPLSDKDLIANRVGIGGDKNGNTYFLSSKEKSGPKTIGLIRAD